MFEEPDEPPSELPADPAARAQEKSQEFRQLSLLAAVFEGPRKFDAEVTPDLTSDIARAVQKTMARLEKAKSQETPVLPPNTYDEVRAVFALPKSERLSTSDYHVYPRPGETMLVRWLVGEEVEAFFERLQAHFDSMLDGFLEDERQQHAWRNDEQTTAYLKALDEARVTMADLYLRDTLQKYPLFALSTFAVDEMNLIFICDQFMGVDPARVVGEASAPGDDLTEKGDPWFFKLFVLRGSVQKVEHACFFVYLQKSDEDW